VAIVNPVTALDYVGRDVVLRRFSERLDYCCMLAMPSGKPLTSFAQQLLSTMRARLANDLDQLMASLDQPG
jgi:hypothetical protein